MSSRDSKASFEQFTNSWDKSEKAYLFCYLASSLWMKNGWIFLPVAQKQDRTESVKKKPNKQAQTKQMAIN